MIATPTIIGDCTLYLGDSLSILPMLEPPSIGAVITDPPYGINYIKGTGGRRGAHSTGHQNIEPVFGDDRPFDPTPLLRFPNLIVWGADHYASKLPPGRFLAWDKCPGRSQWDSFSDVEFAWHSLPGASRIFRYMWKGLCQGAGEDKNTRREHPTQKPVCLLRWCIAQSKSPPDKPILDPFMGSGSTAIAAIRSGFPFIGIEILPKYFHVACQRIRDAYRAQGERILEPESERQTAASGPLFRDESNG